MVRLMFIYAKRCMINKNWGVESIKNEFESKYNKIIDRVLLVHYGITRAITGILQILELAHPLPSFE